MPLVFEQYKTLRLKGLEFIAQHSGHLNSYEKRKLELVTRATSQTENIAELGAALTLSTPNNNVGFLPVEPLSDPNPENLTCFKFGAAPLAWYFLYGQYSDGDTYVTFTLMVFKQELAAPEVVKSSEFLAEDAAIWCLSGGVGVRHGLKAAHWHSIPFNNCTARYDCNGLNGFRLAFDTSGSSYLKKFTLESVKRGEFKVHLKYQSYENQALNFKASLKNQSSAVYNGPGGCVPCIGGVGTIYWSYPLLDSVATFQLPELKKETRFTDGVGWFDHQYLQGDYVPNGWIRLLKSFTKPKTLRWLWLNLQFEKTKTQWMISKVLDAPLTRGDKVNKFEILNLYDEKGAHFALTEKEIQCAIEVIETEPVTSEISQQTLFFPTKLRISLTSATSKETSVYIMKRDFGAGSAYLPSGNLNIESCGSIWNETESVRLGNCFFEFNNWFDDKDLNETPLKLMGYSDAKDLAAFNI